MSTSCAAELLGIKVGTLPVYMSVNPDTHKIYVTYIFTKKLSVIDESKDSLIHNIPIPTAGAFVDVDPTYNLVYLVNHSDHTVSVLDGDTDMLTNTIRVKAFPQSQLTG
jgi:DNA-binding beta-propeller fold protein YncE